MEYRLPGTCGRIIMVQVIVSCSICNITYEKQTVVEVSGYWGHTSVVRVPDNTGGRLYMTDHGFTCHAVLDFPAYPILAYVHKCGEHCILCDIAPDAEITHIVAVNAIVGISEEKFRSEIGTRFDAIDIEIVC